MQPNQRGNMRKKAKRRKRKRPWIGRLLPTSEMQKVLDQVKNLNACHKQIPAKSPADYMQNQSILIAGCKEVCARYRIPWKLVEHRALLCNEPRPDSAIILCNKVRLDARLLMHQPCKGRGCDDCKRTGLDALMGDGQ